MANFCGSPGSLGSSFSGWPLGWPILYTRGDSDIMSRALVAAGAERLPLEEFWTLDEDGDGLAHWR